LKVANDLHYDVVEEVVDLALGANTPQDTHILLKPLGVYQAEDESTKNVSFRITITAANRTLKETEVTSVTDAIAAEAHEELGAERV
jgi:phenylalanyl-tRNA synthetase beta subunit